MHVYFKSNCIVLIFFLLLLSSCNFTNETLEKCKKFPDKNSIPECVKSNNKGSSLDQNNNSNSKCNKIGCLEKRKLGLEF